MAHKFPTLLTRLRNVGVPDHHLKTIDALLNDPKNTDFYAIICWISKQLQNLCNLECSVSQGNEIDSMSFSLEVNSLLKELNCPYDSLFLGPIAERFLQPLNRLLLINFLLGELNAAQILSKNKDDHEGKMMVKVKESDTAKSLREIAISLGLGKPPNTITPKVYFQKVENKLNEFISKHSMQIYLPLFMGTLTEKQWVELEHLVEELKSDYRSRKIMSIERLNLTLQSFCWDSKVKNASEKISQVCKQVETLNLNPDISVADLLASRQDLLTIEKTSGPMVRKNTKSSINNVIIGAVPDRGGRPDEAQPPPPEVPSWQKSSNTQSFGGGNQGGRHSSSQPSYNNQDFRSQNAQQSNAGYDNYRSHNMQQPNAGRDNYRSHNMQQPNAGRDNYRSHNMQQPNSGYDNYRSHNMQQPNSGYDNYRTKNTPQQYNTQESNAGYGNSYGYKPEAVYSYQGTESYGFGGYAATGGNFQQFGVTPQLMEQQQFYGNQSGGRGQYSRGGGRGGRPRGNYRQNRY